jgi:Domain of unknown function (DUF3943)
LDRKLGVHLSGTKIALGVALFTVSVTLALAGPLSPPDSHYDADGYPFKIAEYSLALDTAAVMQNDAAGTDALKPPTRDCQARSYEVTLFNPCEGEDATALWRKTKIVFYGGFAVMGIILLLPEDISNWDRSEIGGGNMLHKWYDNVKAGPVWDNDKWYINYIGHPYFGSVYYQAARTSGYNQWNSMVYSALMSTFYWEYGVEAFAEIPSLQDLVVTPLGGWIWGEWAYYKKKEILANGGMAMGSKSWGNVALFFLDPISSIDDWVRSKSKDQVRLSALNISQRPATYSPDGVKRSSSYWELSVGLEF